MDFESPMNPSTIMQTIFFSKWTGPMRFVSLAALVCIAINASAQSMSATANGGTNQSPTYLRDIQPIFMGNCSRCHNQESRFVYNWLDYKTAYADRWEIRRRIWDSCKGTYYKESMPIANSPESLALTDEERQLIREWVDSGSPRGVPPPANAPHTKAERIQLGQ